MVLKLGIFEINKNKIDVVMSSVAWFKKVTLISSI